PLASTLRRTVAPVERSWTKASPWPSTSPATRSSEPLVNATQRPSRDIEPPTPPRLPSAPVELTEMRERGSLDCAARDDAAIANAKRPRNANGKRDERLIHAPRGDCRGTPALGVVARAGRGARASASAAPIVSRARFATRPESVTARCGLAARSLQGDRRLRVPALLRVEDHLRLARPADEEADLHLAAAGDALLEAQLRRRLGVDRLVVLGAAAVGRVGGGDGGEAVARDAQEVGPALLLLRGERGARRDDALVRDRDGQRVDAVAELRRLALRDRDSRHRAGVEPAERRVAMEHLLDHEARRHAA